VKVNKKKISQSYIPYLLLLPSLFFTILFIIYPLAFSLFLSFHSWNGLSPNMRFLGLKNFERLLTDPVFWIALKNNLLFSTLVVIGTVLIGLALALLIHRQIKGWKVFRAIYYFPVLLTSTVIALLWTRFYDPYSGLFNEFLKIIGLSKLTHAWLGDPNTAIFAVIAKEIWQYSGFPMIILLAALVSIPDAYLEAAQIDGATYFKTLRLIILPQIKNVLAITVALQIIFSFKVFDAVWAMTLGGPGNASQVLATYMYHVSFGISGSPLEFGYASAIAIIMLVIITPVALLYLRLVKFGEMTL